MYKQTDGVAMGSPLGPALANIFVGYYEEKLFSLTQKPPTYFRYVDDTFAIFDHKAEADEFLTKLNCLYPSLRFTFEKEKPTTAEQLNKNYLDSATTKTTSPHQNINHFSIKAVSNKIEGNTYIVEQVSFHFLVVQNFIISVLQLFSKQHISVIF